MSILKNIKLINFIMKQKMLSIIIGTLFTPTIFALDLAQQPLTLSGFNYPNVMFLLDDSGSMDWEVMSGVHWAACDYDPYEYYSHSGSITTDCNEKITDGRMYIENVYHSSDMMTYIFNNTGNIYGSCSGSYSYGFECSGSYTGEWRHRSADLNFMFYNPNTSYEPWTGECSSGVDCANASFTAARSNPRNGESGYTSTRNLNGQFYEVWFDTAGFSNTRPNITDYTSGSNNYIDLWDEHYKIEFVSTSQVKVYSYIYTSPGSSSLGESFSVLLNSTATSSCLNILGPKSLVDSIHDGVLSVSSTGGTGCRTISEAAQNFANWYQYHRKRSLSAKATISSLVTEEEDIRFGLTLINDYNDVFVEVPSGGQDTFNSHNDTLLSDLYNYNWQSQGTPLRDGLKTVGEYYDGDLSGKTDPIQYSCQQNFTVLLTDGEWNGSSPSIGNSDGDAYSNTLADVADYYYQNDLSSLDNDVAINEFDTQTQQHMVTFMAAFGLEGTLSDTDDDGWPNPILGRSSTWGGNPSSSSYKADDMWHAAFNSKGIYSAAKSPELLRTNLEAAFSSIQARVGSASSVATSSSVLQAGAIIYQSEYNSAGWEGNLKAYAIVDDVIQEPSWDSACYFGDCSISGFNPTQISYSSRVVLTSVDGVGIPFQWPSDSSSPSSTEFSSAQITNIVNENNTSYSDDTYGQKLINFIRGSDSDEVNADNTSGDFRRRDNTLGDFVNSRPLYISSPNRFYASSLESASYASFKSTYSSRAAMLYVGGNDGMLHAFDASNGQEKLAYIPGTRHIFENLPQLSSTTYTHLYFVDGSPTEGDVFYDSGWHTVLAGGLSAGGQAVYLLDITDPANFTEANAGSIVKWEFTDVDDNELGMTFSQPQIARMANGKWAVIFGNGYNNTASDGHASTTGKSHLFILFLNDSFDGVWDEGVDYVKIPVGSSYLTVGDAAGLSHVQAVDVDGDFDVDYIYAGDIKGKMWRFNVSSNVPSNWSGSLSFDAGVNQPITTKPSITSHPYGISNGFQVFFGTGKFIELDDNSTAGQTTQTLYSIWDKISSGTFSSVPSVSNLLQQEILAEPDFSTDVGGRVTTNNSIDWTTHRGWYLNLIVKDSGNNQGERIISNPIIRNNRIMFTTMLPSTDNICDGGGGGWLMSLNASTGSRPEDQSFDLNSDGSFTSADYVTDNGTNYVSSGIQFNSGILATPTILNSTDGTYDLNILSGTGGENSTSGLDAIKTNVPSYAVGRLSWKRLR